MSFPAGENTLAGTVCLPDGDESVPVILFVHGSGPLDRNENTQSGKLDVFNQIAHYLAEHGIGSLRYDKRGCGQSTGSYLTAGHLDLVNDAQAAVAFLLEEDFGEKAEIHVLGHSEGSVIAPQVARNDSRVASVLLLCPFSKSLKQILQAQAFKVQADVSGLGGFKGSFIRLAMKIQGGPMSSHRKLVQKLENSTKPCIRYGFKKLNAKWFRELFALNMKDAYMNLSCPALLVGGQKDIQCDPEDVYQIRTWLDKESTEVHVIADMTHLLRRDHREPSFFHYPGLMKEPIDGELLHIIQRWVIAGHGS